MSKKYVCDVCNTVVDDPYSAKMREFNLNTWIRGGAICAEKVETKRKIHICGGCYEKITKAAPLTQESKVKLAYENYLAERNKLNEMRKKELNTKG